MNFVFGWDTEFEIVSFILLILLNTFTYIGAKTIAPIISAMKFIEIITVKIIAISSALNTHIIKIVQTLFVSIPKAPAKAQGKISLTNSFWESFSNLFAK